MDWISPLWKDLRVVIGAAWPEVTQVFRVTQIERRNWTRLIERAKLVPPWVTVYLPPTRPSTEWGVSNVAYQPLFTVYYVAASRASDDMGAYLESKLIALQDEILSYAWPNSKATILVDSFATDVSDENPINMVMLEGDMPYMSGGFTLSLVTGFVANS